MLAPRKYPRFAVHFPIAFGGDQEGEGIVSNLSLGGCHVLSDTVVGRKDYLTIRLYHSFEKPPIKIDVAAVRWSGVTGFGLEFLSIMAAEQEKLSRFLETLQSGT
jgi:c-di-GMP-binding flagellar brake protein YcgR